MCCCQSRHNRRDRMRREYSYRSYVVLEECAMPRGIVKWFDAKKGYGFIVGPQEGRDIFVHYTHIMGDGFRSLRDGEQVDYELAESDKGLQARGVRPINREPETQPRANVQPAMRAQSQQAQMRH